VKRFIQFVKTTVIGGLVVIVPLAILVFFVSDAVDTLVEATRPFTMNLPFAPLVNTLIAVLVVTIGQVRILPASRVTKMELSMAVTIGCLSQMGLEAGKMYAMTAGRSE
jgi:hypothetical protein